MMDKFEKLINLCNLVQELELSLNKARKMGAVITNDYFGLDENCLIVAYFETGSTLHNILTDYLFESEKLLKEIKELLDEVETEAETTPADVEECARNKADCKSVKERADEMIGLIDNDFDMSYSEMTEIQDSYGCSYEAISTIFDFGYRQGQKAEKARVTV